MNSRSLAPYAALFICLACRGEGRQVGQIPEPFRHPERQAVYIGFKSHESGSGSLGVTVAARLTASGNYVVVLDGFSPFIKVFDRLGRTRAAFLRADDVPATITHPSALAVAGDSLILVADRNGRIALYDLDGRPQGPPQQLSVIPLAAVSVCDGDWLVYGPPSLKPGRENSTAGTIDRRALWLHRIHLGPHGAAVTDAFPQSLAADGLAIGIDYGLVGDSAGALLRDELGDVPDLVIWKCAGTVTASRRRGALVQPRVKFGGSLAKAPPAGAHAQAGIALVDGGLMTADLVVGARARNGHRYVSTEFDLLRGKDLRRVTLPGSYLLRDSKPGLGILVEMTQPVPQLLLLSESDVLSMFARVASGGDELARKN